MSSGILRNSNRYGAFQQIIRDYLQQENQSFFLHSVWRLTWRSTTSLYAKNL